MRIRIYIEPSGAAVGGLEATAAVLAEWLQRSHTVEILHRKPSLSIERLQETFDCDLSRVTIRHLAVQPFEPYGLNPIARLARARTWDREVSEGCDVLISLIHGLPPFCHAPIGILYVPFPFYRRPQLEHGVNGLAAIKASAGLQYERFEWRRRFATYRLVTANSEYTRGWIRRFWGIDSSVVYAPVDPQATRGDKEDLILSVGRFTAGAHSKRQVEMMRAFASSSLAKTWRYVSAGTVADNAADRQYVEQVRDAGAGTRASVVCGIPRDELRSLYRRSRLFWHAAGFGADQSVHPELMEHFGIVTVEAMAAGAVPIVVRRGGQPEIVEHAVSGYLWDDIAQLGTYSEELARDSARWSAMSEAAITKARTFDGSQFIERFRAETMRVGVTL